MTRSLFDSPPEDSHWRLCECQEQNNDRSGWTGDRLHRIGKRPYCEFLDEAAL